MTKPSGNVRKDRVRRALPGTDFVLVDWVDETGSTNADLLAAASTGAPHGSVLVADQQTAGRGRHGRRWESEPGDALLVSVLLRPSTVSFEPSWIVSATAVALVEAIKALGARSYIKWPNDVVVADADGNLKLAGILAESSVIDNRVDAVVVGIGCNISADIESRFDTATSLQTALDGRIVDRADLLVAFLAQLQRELENPLAVVARYRDRSVTLGKPVRVELPDGPLLGTAVDIDDSGALVLDVAGEQRTINAGDVVHLRSA